MNFYKYYHVLFCSATLFLIVSRNRVTNVCLNKVDKIKEDILAEITYISLEKLYFSLSISLQTFSL